MKACFFALIALVSVSTAYGDSTLLRASDIREEKPTTLEQKNNYWQRLWDQHSAAFEYQNKHMKDVLTEGPQKAQLCNAHQVLLLTEQLMDRLDGQGTQMLPGTDILSLKCSGN